MTELNPELPDYIKPSDLILKKRPNKEKEVRQFKNFMEMLNKIQANILFGETLKQMLVYSKFMKELLLGNGS